MHDQRTRQALKRQILRAGMHADEPRDHAFKRVIASIPAGRVSTYGHVAAAAGYPLHHRAVARLLRTAEHELLPWHRVLGAGGAIKTRGAAAHEQRARLVLEGVPFRGERVDLHACEHLFRTWELPD